MKKLYILFIGWMLLSISLKAQEDKKEDIRGKIKHENYKTFARKQVIPGDTSNWMPHDSAFFSHKTDLYIPWMHPMQYYDQLERGPGLLKYRMKTDQPDNWTVKFVYAYLGRTRDVWVKIHVINETVDTGYIFLTKRYGVVHY